MGYTTARLQEMMVLLKQLLIMAVFRSQTEKFINHWFRKDGEHGRDYVPLIRLLLRGFRN